MKISVHATEGPLEGLWAFFSSAEEAILYMSRKNVPFRVYMEPQFQIQPAWAVLDDGKRVASFNTRKGAQAYVDSHRDS